MFINRIKRIANIIIINMDSSRVERNGRDLINGQLHTYISLSVAKALIKEQMDIKPNTRLTKRWLYKKLCTNEYVTFDTMQDSTFEILYLHLIIMFSTHKHLLSYLSVFSQRKGAVAAQLLVNNTLMDNSLNPLSAISITPLLLACLWQNDPEYIRVLYKFGADVSDINTIGLYPEESYAWIPYYNHLSFYIAYKNPDYHYSHVWGHRLINEFIPIINEFKYIVGELQYPTNWVFPKRLWSYSFTLDSPTSRSSRRRRRTAARLARLAQNSTTGIGTGTGGESQVQTGGGEGDGADTSDNDASDNSTTTSDSDDSVTAAANSIIN